MPRPSSTADRARHAAVAGTRHCTSRRWHFHTRGGDTWTWSLLDPQGLPLAHNERRFPSYWDCVEDARRYGYGG